MRRKSRNIFALCYGCWLVAIVLVLTTSTSGCDSGKAAASAEQMAALDQQLKSNQWRLEVEFAMPMASPEYVSAANLGVTQARGSSVTNVNLTGEGYYLEMRGDSIKAYLPYYGRRDNVTRVGGRGGIELDTEYTEYKIRNSRSGKTLEFFARDGYERFRFLMELSPSGRTEVSVFSPQRDVIRYRGMTRFQGATP